MYLKNNLANIALMREQLIGGDFKDLPLIPEPEEAINTSKKLQKRSKYQNLDPKLNKLWKFKKYMRGFRMSFLYRWSSTYNFNQWMHTYPTTLTALSSFSSNINTDFTSKTKIYYENGDVYTGTVVEGKRQDQGILEENDGFRYDGHWIADQVFVN